MKVTQTKERTIGTFKVRSGALVVSDPCYESGALYAALFAQAKIGVWVGSIGLAKLPNGVIAITELTVSVVGVPNRSKWICSGVSVGVDSGHIGIFDRDRYDDRSMMDMDHATAVSPFGVVSISGFGDGVYSCLVKQHEGKTVAIKVVFIDLDDLEGGDE
jgi:hypothetical protein